MKEGRRVYGDKTERKDYGRRGRRRWRGNLLRKVKLDKLTEGSS
jgi:hypothetical protein